MRLPKDKEARKKEERAKRKKEEVDKYDIKMNQWFEQPKPFFKTSHLSDHEKEVLILNMS